MRSVIRNIANRDRSRHLARGGAQNKAGRGVYTVMLLRRARSIVAEDASFCGSCVDAVRRAAVILDLNDEIAFAARVLIHVCGPEVPLRTILKTRDKERVSFRNRMLLNFDNAEAALIESAKPSYKSELGKRSAAEATNWAGITKAEKDARWVETFEKAVDAEDKRRSIAHSLQLVDRLYPNREADAPEVEPVSIIIQ